MFAELELMVRLMDRVPDGIAPMLQDLVDHIVSAGLADMQAAADLITQVSLAEVAFAPRVCAAGGWLSKSLCIRLTMLMCAKQTVLLFSRPLLMPRCGLNVGKPKVNLQHYLTQQT